MKKLKSGRECPVLKPITQSQRLMARSATTYSRVGGGFGISGLEMTTFYYAAFALGLSDISQIDDLDFSDEEIREIGNLAAEEDKKGSDPTSGD